MQLGAQLFRAKVLPLPYLDRGQRIYARLPGLLPGRGRAHLACHLKRCREKVGHTDDVGNQVAYVPGRTVGGPGPVFGLESVDGVGDALVLGPGKPRSRGPFDHWLEHWYPARP